MFIIMAFSIVFIGCYYNSVQKSYSSTEGIQMSVEFNLLKTVFIWSLAMKNKWN